MFYLLGIPLAIASMKVLKDDIKYTKMDARVPRASHNLNKQYKQINEHFVDILDYSGAKCDIKKRTYGKDISNVKKGQYGGMERYLAEKGYFSQAIDYAKNRFDALADKETEISNSKRDSRINDFEHRLALGDSNMMLIDLNVKYTQCPKPLVEKEIERVINYLHNHHNKNVYCNIIMSDGRVPFLNHREVWHIEVPANKDGVEYLGDVYNKLNVVYYVEE